MDEALDSFQNSLISLCRISWFEYYSVSQTNVKVRPELNKAVCNNSMGMFALLYSE